MVHPANCKVSFETLGIFFLDSRVKHAI